jgi:hypothetical protein
MKLSCIGATYFMDLVKRRMAIETWAAACTPIV